KLDKRSMPDWHTYSKPKHAWHTKRPLQENPTWTGDMTDHSWSSPSSPTEPSWDSPLSSEDFEQLFPDPIKHMVYTPPKESTDPYVNRFEQNLRKGICPHGVRFYHAKTTCWSCLAETNLEATNSIQETNYAPSPEPDQPDDWSEVSSQTEDFES